MMSWALKQCVVCFFAGVFMISRYKYFLYIQVLVGVPP